MAKALLAVIPWLFDVVVKYLHGPDTNKHRRIAALVVICLLLPPATLYTIQVGQRIYYQVKNPHAYPRPLARDGSRPRPADRSTGEEHDHRAGAGEAAAESSK